MPKRQEMSDSDSGEDIDNSEEEQVSDDEESPLQTRKDGSDESSEDEAVSAFMNRHNRMDQKDVTLHLKSSILNLYFETIVGEGRWDKEDKKNLGTKYYLSDKH